MRKHFTLWLSVFFCLILFGQKKKKMRITSDAEASVLIMKPLGNNTYAKDFKPFYGFGIGGQLQTPINFGVGFEANILYSDVKYGRQNLYGNLGSQKLTNFDLSLLYRLKISENFSAEPLAGLSLYRLYSSLYPEKGSYSEGQGGFHIGGKGLFNLDNDGRQQFIFGAKARTFRSGVTNENPAIDRYYKGAIFLSGFFGYRYHF